MNIERLVKNFMNFVQIDSESKNEQEMMKATVDYLQKLGLKVFTDSAGEKIGSNGNNIYAFLDGVGEPILLSAHLDTVKPGNNIVPIINNGVISSQGDTILGADDKSGIVVILEAIETILEANLNHRPIEISFSIYEEGGLFGVKEIEFEHFKSKNMLVFDAGGGFGAVVNRAAGKNHFEIIIQGKSAHAGIEPEKGVNAFTIASAAMNNLNIGRIDFETTSNIGIDSGGIATNIVMDQLKIEGEVRSLCTTKLKEETAKIIDAFEESATKCNSSITYNIRQDYAAFHTNLESAFTEEVKLAFAQIGVSPRFEDTGGGSDGNIFATKKINPLIVSTGMEAVHTFDEHIKISDMEKCCEFLIAYLKTP